MRVTLIAARSTSPFRWQAEVARRLAEAGHDVVWQTAEGAPEWPSVVHLLLEMERLVYRRPAGERPLDRVPRRDPPAGPKPGRDDLVLDLSGASAGPPDALRPLYDGVPDPAAAVAALLDRQTVTIELAMGERSVVRGRPGSEDRALLSTGLDALFARAADLCCAAVARLAARPGSAGDDAPDRLHPVASRRLGPAGLRAAGFSAASLAGKARGVLLRRLRRPDAWRVGLRGRGGRDILDQHHITPDGFGWLRDDGRRYYADPFLITHEGRTWLFVEEYPYATHKGVISACEVFDDGTFGPTRVVLEETVHLSYPHVFARDGALWMIPESSAAGELVLYRATEFPWRWQRERVLVSGAVLADATPVWHEDRLWLFASATGLGGGSSSDALVLFHAPHLFGDVSPHPLNPVLVDAESARPGGRVVRQGGRLLRVAQDCRTGYGRGAVLASVDRLDPEGYGQTVVAELRPPPAWKAVGLHAVERGERFEALDILAPAFPPDAVATSVPATGSVAALRPSPVWQAPS